MTRVLPVLFLLLLPLCVLAADETYTNPIIHADYSDPDVIRVGDDFYLTASSFNCVPGLPILHSKDLINWRIIGHALQKQLPAEVFSQPQHGNGVWAPAIRFHNGDFYIYYGDPDFGIYMVKARNAAGPWSQPLLIKAAKGWIDPAPFWDDDGNAYLVHAWANSRSGIKSILTINRMSADGTRLLDEGRTVFDGRVAHPTIEGPKLYKRNGYYYIFAPAGGVTSGWQTVLRSKNIYGPYEDRIVMDRGRTMINGPHQGSWVELKSGESWFVHFQDRGAFGRIVHLQPVNWINDWPVIGVDPDGDGKGEPVTTYRKPNVGREYPVQSPQTSDEFNAGTLGLQWQWHANPQAGWLSFTERGGRLSLTAVPQPENGQNLWTVPNVLLQKLPAPDFLVTTLVDAS
ncbi:MAG TPA: family 43 glycosylhydrolase, partial [Pyrinomonadaceae bacterium]|nr:family 43 glycosylhydrolase [Pyrinomonadaceae bacterium]